MVSKKAVVLGLFLIFSVMLISAVSAEIIISQPKAIYNLGDDFSSSVTVDSLKPGYLDINLECSGSSENIYHNVPDAKVISLTRKLIPVYIGNSSGSCYLAANYAEETKTGTSFEISNLIEVNIMTQKVTIEAGNKVQIKGTAYKSNNQLVGQVQSAFVEVSSEYGNLSASGIVKDGQFSLEILVPETTRAGNKTLKIRVYDTDDASNRLNSGESSAELSVTQKLAKVSLATDKPTANPEENITIIAFATDAAGDVMPGSISLKITQNQQSLYEGLVEPNFNFNFKIEKNSIPGLVLVTASKGGMTSEKTFEINSVKNLSIEVGNETLLITNIGNVPYQGDVEVKIGSQSFLETVDLQVGDYAKYSLSAPDGVYEINIVGDSASFNQPGVALTGNAIDIQQVKDGADYIMARYPIVWIFLAIVIASTLFLWYRKYEKNKRFSGLSLNSYNKPKYQEIKRQGGVQVIKPEETKDKIEEIVLHGELRRAEQVLVQSGKKSPAAIIAIKLKKELRGIAKDSFKKSLEYAYKNKAVSNESGDYILLIFSPLLTKNMKNEEIAIRVASDIDGYLNDHNRKFRNDKISYGIGVNSGEIINKVEGRTLQFTNVGKTINIAKRIADVANDEVLLSKDIHEKTPSVKTEKLTSGAIEAFTIKRIVNSEESKKFINEFMRRNTTK